MAKAAIWPKLYRRLIDFLSDENAGDFKKWLKDNDKDDETLILSLGKFNRLSGVISISGGKYKLKHPPEDIMIKPR